MAPGQPAERQGDGGRRDDSSSVRQSADGLRVVTREGYTQGGNQQFHALLRSRTAATSERSFSHICGQACACWTVAAAPVRSPWDSRKPWHRDKRWVSTWT